jgi:hypothetical protein
LEECELYDNEIGLDNQNIMPRLALELQKYGLGIEGGSVSGRELRSHLFFGVIDTTPFGKLLGCTLQGRTIF